jgi:alpha-ketoglutarate-dependent taurine dioxygenase
MSVGGRFAIDSAAASVFRLENAAAFARWRDRKMQARARNAGDLIVEVRDPRKLSAAEHAALLERLRRANMAIYASRVCDEDRSIPRRVGARFGLRTLDANLLAEDDGVTRITVDRAKAAAGFIPYTMGRMLWHTDGYYNAPAMRVRSMLLHCVRPASQGGDTALLDHELAWLLLREADPRLVEALMQPDALTIPERRDEDGVARPAASGPVFSVDPGTGDLHARFTARRRSVEWKCEAAVSEAAARLLAILDGDACVLRTRLEAGMGLVCNNVFHARTTFTDDAPSPRLLYRARFLERIAGTEGAWAALLR